MTSGQWDLNALEALERAALEVFDVLEVPEHVRRSPPNLTPAGHSHHHHQHLHHHQQQLHHRNVASGVPGASTATATDDDMEIELEDHIKHCSCTCNHMGYGNFMDYQTSCFGGLPDVTEHSNRHKISRRETTMRSEPLESNTTCLAHQKAPLSPSRETTPVPTIITNVTDRTLNSKQSPDTDQRKKRDSTASTKDLNSNRKCCCCAFTSLLTLVACAVAGVFVAQIMMGQIYSDDRESQEQRLRLVHRILQETPLIDGHNDLPWNIRSFAHNRLEYLNFSDGLDQTEPWNHSPWSQTDLPRLKSGLVGAQFWSAYVPCEAQGLDAVQLALEQIDLIQRFCETYHRHMELVVSSSEVLATHRQGLIASLIGVEGGHALGSSLSVLRSMYALGARYLTLTHSCDNRWAGSSESPEKGLSPFGRVVIKEMNRLGMMIDLSHSSDATARDVLRETRAPVIFSHSAARSLCNSSRNIGDDTLRAVADNGGIVMVSFYAKHVTCSQSATLRDVVAHINHIRDIAGVQHVGIGAGYDGIDSPPTGLENVSKYPDLFAELLRDASWSPEDLQLLSGKNILRVFRSVENVRDHWKSAAISPMETRSPPKISPCTYMPS